MGLLDLLGFESLYFAELVGARGTGDKMSFDMEKEKQILGCLLGGALGDSLGGPYEGGPDLPVFTFPTTYVISDDTQLTLATCQALRGNKPNPEKIANSFLAWYRQGRISGIGGATLKALRELAVGGHWALVGRKGEYAAGNGAAIRMAPLAFVSFDSDREFRATIKDLTWITHQNNEAYVGALAMVLAVKHAFHKQVPKLNFIEGSLPDSRVRDRILTLSKISEDLPLKEISILHGNSGYVVDSVPLALLGAERIIKSGDFETHLIDLICGGGDTDTIASMAGQISGSYLGEQALPAHLINQIEKVDLIREIGHELAAELI